jgi:hypothetical protein
MIPPAIVGSSLPLPGGVSGAALVIGGGVACEPEPELLGIGVHAGGGWNEPGGMCPEPVLDGIRDPVLELAGMIGVPEAENEGLRPCCDALELELE